MTFDLLLLGASLMVWGIGESAFFFFNPLHLQELGADPILIGSILGVVGLAMSVAHIPAGYFADKIGRRPLLWIASILGVIAGLMMAIARSLPLFAAGMILYGLTAFIIAPLNSYVTAARGKFSVARAITITSAMYNTGAIIGPLLGGWVGAHYSLRTVYAVGAVFFILSTLMLFAIRAQPVETHDPTAPPTHLFTNWKYIAFVAMAFVAIFAMYLPQPLAANFLQNERGINIESIGTLGSLNSIGIVVLSLALGHIAPQFGFFVSQLTTAMFAAILWKATDLPWFYAAYILLGGYRVARPLIIAQVRSLIHSSQMGLAYGLTETIVAVPIIIAPPIAGFLYARDPGTVFPLSVILIAISIAIGIIFLPRIVQPASETQTIEPAPTS